MRRLFLVILLATAPACARAQGALPLAPPPAPPQIGLRGEQSAADPPAAESEAARRGEELRGLEDSARASEGERRRIEGEVERMRADRARLAAALIDTARKAQEAETRAGEVEKRLDALTGSEQAIRASLESRRALIAEVLAAAQRMGRRPPPAIMADPADMLRAIRSAMMLGAVLPHLREETQALADDLAEMTRLRAAIALEQGRLADELKALSGERERLAALVEERKAALAPAEQALAEARLRSAELARQATSLKDLIQRMEGEATAAARAAADARRADDAERAEAAAHVRARLALAPALDPARLAPGQSFAALKGKLPWPAAGEVAKPYGVADGFGGDRSVALRVRPGATVIAPADARVVFAGAWRGWGRVLILDPGEGHLLVLAGLARADVEAQQFVLAGEPVGAMGEGAARAAAAISAAKSPGAAAPAPAAGILAVGGGDPILYVELRKDGSSIDPGPWWAKRDARPDVRQDVRQDSEKARG